MDHCDQLPEGVSITKALFGTSAFETVLRIRATRCAPAVAGDPGDASADHYVLTIADKPCATLRVQQARRATLDCEPFYPQAFLRRFRGSVASASRLVRAADCLANPRLLRRLVATAWRDQFEDGMRVDLINVHLPMQPYYLAMGYETVPGTFFEHPRLHTSSTVMCLIADRTARTPLASCFVSDHDPELVQQLRAELLGAPALARVGA